MLDDGNYFELTKVVEKLIKFFLACTVENQIGTENENSSRQYWQNFKRLESDDAIKQKVYLVDLQRPNKAEVDPRKSRAQRVDSELIHVVTDFGLVHLQQVLEQFAKTDDGLGAVGDTLQLAEVLAEHGTEDKVTLFFGVTDITERCTIPRKSLSWKHTCLWEHAARLVVRA